MGVRALTTYAVGGFLDRAYRTRAGTLPPMGTMRALRKTSARRGADLEDIPVPEPGEGEVLVRVHAASICGTDLHIYDWNEWAQGRIPRLPMTFGHEVAGWVERVGPEVHHVAPGAFVAAETHIACGICSTCRTGRAHICRNLRILGVDTEGAFAEYVVVPAANVWIVGEGIDPDHASVMEPFGNAVLAAFRFIPIFDEEYASKRAAAQERGGGTSSGITGAIRSLRRDAVPLLAGAIRRSERLALAMDSRAFGAYPTRTYHRTLRVTRADWAFLGAVIVGSAVLFGVLAATGLLKGVGVIY